jgi:hypothetical protein
MFRVRTEKFNLQVVDTWLFATSVAYSGQLLYKRS